jgi:hypothetical protein
LTSGGAGQTLADVKGRAVSAAVLALTITAAASGADRPTLTLSARETPNLELSGALSSGAAGESIVVEGSECKGFGYRIVAGASTSAGGAWLWRGAVQIRTTFRARWRDVVSNAVVVEHPIYVVLERRPGTRVFRAGVFSRMQNMHGRIVELQRFAPAQARWVRVQRARLTRGAGETSYADFRILRRGLLLRAFVPAASAAPCFRAGASRQIRS